jgi:hypothetical protein
MPLVLPSPDSGEGAGEGRLHYFETCTVPFMLGCNAQL